MNIEISEKEFNLIFKVITDVWAYPVMRGYFKKAGMTWHEVGELRDRFLSQKEAGD